MRKLIERSVEREWAWLTVNGFNGVTPFLPLCLERFYFRESCNYRVLYRVKMSHGHFPNRAMYHDRLPRHRPQFRFASMIFNFSLKNHAIDQSFRFASSLHIFIILYTWLFVRDWIVDWQRSSARWFDLRRVSNTQLFIYLTNVWSFLVSWLITQEAVSSLNIIKSGCTNVKKHVKSFWDASYHFSTDFHHPIEVRLPNLFCDEQSRRPFKTLLSDMTKSPISIENAY